MPENRQTIGLHVLFIAYIGFVVVGMPAGTLNLAWRYIQSDLNLTFSALGTLLMTASVGQLLVSFYSGTLIARLGVGRFLLLGGLLNLLGYIGFTFAPTWPLLLGAAILTGFGSAVLINALNTFVATNFRSSHMNWLHASFGIGSTMGPLIVTLLVIDRGFPWQSAYMVIIGAFILFMLLVFITRRAWTVPNEGRTQSDPDLRAASIRETMRLPVVWLAIGLFFFSTGTEISTSQLTNTLFVDGRGYDAKMVGTWISTFWLCFTVARALTGLFIDRVDYRLFIRGCMLGAAGGALLIWLNVTPMASFAGFLIMGVTLAPLAPTLFSKMPQRVGMRHALNAMGFINLGAGLGLALPPAFASRMSEIVGLEFIPPFLVVMTLITLSLSEWLLHQKHERLVGTASQPATTKG